MYRITRLSRFVLVFTCATILAIGCSSDDDGATLSCGDGTKQTDGKCVVDANAAAKSLKPKVESVKLTAMHVHSEGFHPVMAMHPVKVSATLEVKGEAFMSHLVVGMRSKDGKKTCVIGYWDITHNGGKDSDKLAAAAQSTDGKAAEVKVEAQEMTLSKDFFVQPGCALLDGETEATTWMSFDPFHRVELAGRDTPGEPKEKGLKPADAESFIQKAELSLKDCKAGAESSHPDTCETKLIVRKSAGKDVVMNAVSLGSTIAIVDVVEPAAIPGGATQVTINGTQVDVAAGDPKKYKANVPTTPHFTANAETVVWGHDGSAEGGIEEGEVSISYSIRPVIIEDEDLNLPKEVSSDWLPLLEEVAEESKAGEGLTIKQLEKVFLSSLVGRTKYNVTAPLYITGKTYDNIAMGVWSNYNLFELRGCAKAAFVEDGIGNPYANNCKIHEVAVLRRHVKASYDGHVSANTTKDSSGAGAGSASSATAVKSNKQGLGNKAKFYVENQIDFKTTYTTEYVEAELKLGKYVMGYYPTALVELRVIARDGTGEDLLDALEGKGDWIAFKLTLIGYALPYVWVPVPPDFAFQLESSSTPCAQKHAGVKKLIKKCEKKESIKKWMKDISTVEKKSKNYCQGFHIAGPLKLELCVQFLAITGMNGGIKKDTNEDQRPAVCNDAKSSKDGKICLLAYKEKLTHQEANDKCALLGGRLAGLDSDQAYTALAKTMTSVGITQAHVALKSSCGGPATPSTTLTTDKNYLIWWANVFSANTITSLNLTNTSSCAALMDGCKKALGVWCKAAGYPASFANSYPAQVHAARFARCKSAEGQTGSCKTGEFASASNWISGGLSGDAKLNWDTDMPSNTGGSHAALVLKSGGDKKIQNVAPSTKLGYACAVVHGGRVSVFLGPYAKTQVQGTAALSLYAIKGGLKIYLDIIHLSVYPEAGLEWWYNGAAKVLFAQLFWEVKAQVRALKGKLCAWYQWWDFDPWYWEWGSYQELCFYKFKGIVLAEKILFREVGKQWRVEAGSDYIQDGVKLKNITNNGENGWHAPLTFTGKADSFYVGLQNSKCKLYEVTPPPGGQGKGTPTEAELTPPHTAHAQIRKDGLGRFSHWSSGPGNEAMYFSTSDNTNPTTNGKSYYLKCP